MADPPKKSLLARVRGLFSSGSGTPPPPEPPPSPRDDDDEPLPEWAGAIGTRARFDSFEQLVREYFRSKGKSVLISDGVVKIPRDANEQTYGLGNILQMCAASPPLEWRETIRAFFDSLATSRGQIDEVNAADGFDKVAHLLSIRLWEEDELEIADKLITREVMPGILGVLVIDLPETVSTVALEQAATWKQDPDDLFERGLANLGDLEPESNEALELHQVLPIHLLQGPSFFTASLALRLESFPDLIGANGALVIIPTRHQLFAVPIDSVEIIQMVAPLIGIANGAYTDGPGSISKRLFWYRGGDWFDIPYAITGDQLDISPPEEFAEMLNSLAPDQQD